MIVEVTDHPLVAFCELEVSLPEAVAVRALEPTLTPNPPWRRDGIIQPSSGKSLADEAFVGQVTFSAAIDAAIGEVPIRITAHYSDHPLASDILVVVKTSVDLVPNDFKASVGSPNVNELTVLSASVTNFGYGSPGNVKAEFLQNGRFFLNVSNPIGPMQSVPFALAWTPNSTEVGENVFMILIDPDHEVDETTRANNNASTTVCVGCGTYHFSVQSNGLTDASARVSVDGIEMGIVTDATPWEANYPVREPHTISVEQCVGVSESVILCTPSYSWNVPETTGTKTVSYSPQYLATITTSPSGGPEPFYSRPLDCPVANHSCWYSASTIPVLYVSWVAERIFDNATRWHPSEVSVDGTSVQADVLQYSLVIDRPHKVELRYVRQYFGNITSDYAILEGIGWKDSGKNFTWYVDHNEVIKSLCETDWCKPFDKFTPSLVLHAVNGSASSYLVGPILGEVKWTVDIGKSLLLNMFSFFAAVLVIVIDKVRGRLLKGLEQPRKALRIVVRVLVVLAAIILAGMTYYLLTLL